MPTIVSLSLSSTAIRLQRRDPRRLGVIHDRQHVLGVAFGLGLQLSCTGSALLTVGEAGRAQEALRSELGLERLGHSAWVPRFASEGATPKRPFLRLRQMLRGR
jgi:hypothetical protein